MFSKVMRIVQNWSGRTKAGVDKHGNIYYWKADKEGGSHFGEKRWVDFKGAFDVNTIPVEWTSWLSGTRRAAPTAQEIIQMEAQRENVKLRAAQLKIEEEKERFRMKASQAGHQPQQGSPEDLEIIMQQIGSGEPGSSRAGKAKADGPSHQQHMKVEGARESPERVAWQPPRKDTKSREPQGSGDNFEPGTWRP